MIGFSRFDTYRYRLEPKNRKIYDLSITLVDGAEVPGLLYTTMLGDQHWLGTNALHIVAGIQEENYAFLAIHSPGDGIVHEILVAELLANEPGFIRNMMATFEPTPAHDIRAIMRAVRVLANDPQDVLQATKRMSAK